MVTVITHKVRHGTPMPVLEANATSNGAVMFIFGYECQHVETCSSEETVLKSEEFCLMGGDWWSASYKALPHKVNDKVLYQATLTKRPVLSTTVNSCVSTDGNCTEIVDFGGNSGGGSSVAPPENF